MKDQSAFRTPRSALRTQGAFTLVEMLTVIAIIGILAALILGGAGIATVKARISRVKSERAALVAAIEQYKVKKGYYPPDNPIPAGNTSPSPTNTYITPLLYELTGTTYDPTKGIFHAVTGESLTTNQVQGFFNVGGFLNSSSDTNEPPINFLKVPLNSRMVSIIIPPGPGTFSLLGVPVPPGLPPTIGNGTGVQMSLWNYVSSNPTNRSGEYDLWIDVVWSGKTNRISNWSEDPQPLP